MNYYLLVHSHEYGKDTTVFQSAKTLNEMPNNKVVAEKFDLDFEPDKLESISIYQIDLLALPEF